jgi:Putative adhesin
MPTYETPDPISVTVELGVGEVRIAATNRSDTVVRVTPSNAGKKGDVTAAEQTGVEFDNGRLLVKAPKGWRQWTPWGGGESVDVEIELPSGSRVWGNAAVAELRCTGRIGDCRYRTGVGDIRLDEAGRVELKTGAGDITVNRVDGTAEVTTGSGAIGIGSIDGSAAIRNGNGDTWVGEVGGNVRVSAANGTISMDVARGTVEAKTALGDVRVGEVEQGSVVAHSAFGSVEVGVRDGVAAWLDLDTKFGSVQNDLDSAEAPGPSENPVEVHAQTSYGDVKVHRSFASRNEREEA